MAEQFEPRIIAFLCKWCSSAGSDLAGVSRMQYPPNVIPITVMCSGSISPLYIFDAFNKGADGVLVTGCRKEQCHFVEGNYKAEEKVEFLKKILDEIGFGGNRLHVQFMSAGEPDEFVKAVTNMVERIRKLGPNQKNRIKIE